MEKQDNRNFAYVNGRVIPAAEAVVSVSDRGFLFGDGVFETIRVAHGIPWMWEYHQMRLQKGLEAIGCPLPAIDLAQAVKLLLVKAGVADGLLRLTVTRGQGGYGYLPPASHNTEPTVVILLQDVRIPDAKEHSLWLTHYYKIHSWALPVESKLLQGLNSILARKEAEEHDCTEALFLNTKGQVCEGSSSSIFWQRGGKLYTPSLSCGLVAGAIRQLLLTSGIFPIEEGEYMLSDLMRADAVFCTNVNWLALPITHFKPAGQSFRSFALAEEVKSWLEKQAIFYSKANREHWLV